MTKEIPLAGCQGVLTALLARPATCLVARDAVVGLVLRELLVVVLAALVLSPRAVGAGLDARGHVLPLEDGLRRKAGEVVRRTDGLEEHRRLDLQATVLGGADEDLDGLAADGLHAEGRVLPLGGGLDAQVHRVGESGRLQEGSGGLDLAGLLDRDRRERTLGHVRESVERDHTHDREGQERERREGAVPVEPLRAARAAGVVWHDNLLDQCARASPYQRSLAASCETGLCSSLPLKLVVILLA
jgi:hypothetical protein